MLKYALDLEIEVIFLSGCYPRLGFPGMSRSQTLLRRALGFFPW